MADATEKILERNNLDNDKDRLVGSASSEQTDY